VVGIPVEGLSLVRSAISGDINSDSLSSTLNWTFVFRNKTFGPQEVRAEVALPSGGVVSDLTLWVDGKAYSVSSQKHSRDHARNGSPNVNADGSGRPPAVVTDLGYPVPAQKELRASLTMTTPMKLESDQQASVTLPKFVDTNFAILTEHELRLNSRTALQLDLKSLHHIQSPVDESEQLVGSLNNDRMSETGLSIRTSRSGIDERQRVASVGGKFITQHIEKIMAAVPKHLVVVLDGSKSMSPYINDLKEALSKIPSNLNASLMVARSNGATESRPLAKAIKDLDPKDFAGGEDNLQAVDSWCATELESGDVYRYAIYEYPCILRARHGWWGDQRRRVLPESPGNWSFHRCLSQWCQRSG
jgi:hypothetical protein